MPATSHGFGVVDLGRPRPRFSPTAKASTATSRLLMIEPCFAAGGSAPLVAAATGSASFVANRRLGGK